MTHSFFDKSNLQIEKRVAAGVAFLDENVGLDWRKKIRLDTLDICEGGDCILGQLFGSYSDGVYTFNLNDDHAVLLGFQAKHSENNTPDLADEYARLTCVWARNVRASWMALFAA